MRIVIADDDAPWVRMMTRYFCASGHDVASASTWVAARALAADGASPDAILLDSSLPDGEAAGFCAALRSDSRFDRTALLLVSGEEPEGGCPGADRSLVKCLPLAEIGSAVATAVLERATAGGGR